MCMICEKSTIVDVMIIDGNTSRIFCPNCLEMLTYTDRLKFVEHPDITDDVYSTRGAIIYVSLNESYKLKANTLRRLILHNLKPEEWKALHKKYVEEPNTFKFMLHDDFYDDEGNALQPNE